MELIGKDQRLLNVVGVKKLRSLLQCYEATKYVIRIHLDSIPNLYYVNSRPTPTPAT